MSSKQRLARELLDTRRLALGHATTPQLSSSSIDGGGLGFRDPDGNDLGSIGIGDDGGFVIDYSGGPKPPKPSPPTVSADAGIFRIEWDGSFENAGDSGVLATSDTDRVEIHASMDENFVPDRVESFGGAFATLDGGSFALGPLPEAGTYYFRLVSRSKSAQFSEPSERVEQELAITSIDLAVTDAWLTGDAAQVTADGKNGIWRGPDEPVEDPDVPFKDGDIWFEMNEDGKSIPNIWDEALGDWVGNDDFRQSEIEKVQDQLRQDLDTVITDGSGTKNFYKPVAPKATDDPAPKEGDLWFDTSEAGANTVHVWTDGAWMSLADARVQEITQAQEDLESDLQDVQTSVDGKNKITYDPALPPASYVGVVGDTWYRTSGNSMIGFWKWDGAAWVQQALSTTVIPQIDIGAGTFGTLTGTRLEAGTVAAEKLLIGKGSNLIPWSTERISPHSATGQQVAAVVTNPTVGKAISVSGGTGASEGGMQFKHSPTAANIPTTPGTKYRFRIKLASTGTLPVGTVWRLQTFWYNEAGSYVGSSFRAFDSLPGLTVTEYVYSPPPRTDAYFVAPHLRIVGNFGDAQILIKEVGLEEQVGATLIQDGAITTDKMAVGSITAESGIIGSINAGTITVGEMDGARIKAQTIAADRLLIGGIAPLNTNPEFSDGLTGWTSTGSPTVSGSVVTLPRWAKISTAALAVTPGQVLRVRAITSGGDVSSTAVGLFMYNATPADPTGNVFIAFNSGNTGQAPGSVIGEHRVTIPAGWTHVRIAAEKGNIGEPATVYSLGAYNAAGATLIQDGSISAEHIRVGAITAESGIIGSIDANVITVGKIMANQLDADAINGKTITGATIRTASSGSRVELTHNGLKQYNSLGATIVDMTAGSFSVAGGSITGSTIKTATSGSRVEITSQGLKQFGPSGATIAEMTAGSMLLSGDFAVDQGRILLRGDQTDAQEGRGLFELRSGAWYGGNADDFRGPGMYFSDPDGGNSGQASIRSRNFAGEPSVELEGFPTRVSSTVSTYAAVSLETTDAKFGVTKRTKTSGGWERVSEASFTAFDVGVANVTGRNTTALWGGPADMILTSDGTGPQVYSKAIRGRSYTGNSANVHITSFGTLGLGSSARRFKADEEVIERGSYEDALLSINYKSWLDREELRLHEEYLAFREAHPMEPVPARLGEAPQEPPERVVGGIAEDFVDAGLLELVQFDEFGRTQGINYDRIGVALIPIVRELRDRIEQLERKLAD